MVHWLSERSSFKQTKFHSAAFLYTQFEIVKAQEPILKKWGFEAAVVVVVAVAVVVVVVVVLHLLEESVE